MSALFELPHRSPARWLLAGLMLNCIGSGLTLPFLYVYLTTVRDLDPSVVGVLGAFIGIVGVMVGFASGPLIDRWGARRVLIPAFVVAGIGTASLSVASSPPLAFLGVLLFAAGNAPVVGAVTTLLTYSTDEDERERVFGLSFAAVNLGIGIGGLIAGLIVVQRDLGSFQRLYVLDALTCLIPIVAVLAMGEVGPEIADDAQPPTGEGGAVTPDVDPDERGGYRAVFGHRAFRLFVGVAMALMVIGYAQFEVGFVAFATDVSEVRPTIVSWAFTIDCFVIVLSQVLVTRLVERHRRSTALAGAAVVFAVAWTVLGLSGTLGSPGGAVAIVGVLAFGALFALAETLMAPVIPAITNALAVEARRGRYNSSLEAASVLASVVGPLTAAPLVGNGDGAVWVTAVVAGSLAAAVGATALRRVLSPVEDGVDPVPVSAGSTV